MNTAGRLLSTFNSLLNNRLGRKCRAVVADLGAEFDEVTAVASRLPVQATPLHMIAADEDGACCRAATDGGGMAPLPNLSWGPSLQTGPTGNRPATKPLGNRKEKSTQRLYLLSA